MSTSIWRIATGGKDHPANDLSGSGAERSGGRWNSPGIPAVYCSQHISLAALEVLAHLNATGLPYKRFIVEVSVPDEVWMRREQVRRFPDRWNDVPSPIGTRQVGDDWAKAHRSALILVPSVIVPEEFNVLLNPHHPDASRVRATILREWRFDVRLT